MNDETAFRILLIEDSPADARLVASYLDDDTTHRFQTEHVSRLSDGIQRLTDGSWDAVLLDLDLPDSQGLYTLQRLLIEDFDSPVVVMTGRDDSQLGLDAVKIGAQDFLTKSRIDPGSLSRTLRNAMERKRAIATQVFTRRLLAISNQYNAIRPMLRHYVQELMKFSRMSAAGVRLFETKKLTFQTFQGFDPVFYDSPEARVVMENGCLCGRVLSGAHEPCGDLYTPGGSFFCTRLAQQLDLLPSRVADTLRQGCLGQGFQTMAIIPIKTGKGRQGVIHLADPDANRLDSSLLQTLEMAGMQLGIGIERVTEQQRNQQMQIQLAQSDRLASVGMLAAGVAHEINNPLTYVLFNLESLKRDITNLAHGLDQCRMALDQALGTEKSAAIFDRTLYQQSAGPSLPDNLLEQVESAIHGAGRVRDIVRDLKSFSRVDDDRNKPILLHDCLESAVNMAYNEIKYRARLVKVIDRVPAIEANEGKMCQVFLNILVNAAQAIPEGDAHSHEIRVHCRQEGDQVVIDIRDTGKGIPPEHLKHLFEPFFTTKPPGVGTGLGLSICNSIVTTFGGRIEVESVVDQGSTFRIIMPVTSRSRSISVEAGQTADESREDIQGRILVVDDEAPIRTLVSRALKRSGHAVIEARDGREAMDWISRNSPIDLVLCDLMMPGLTGDGLYAWVEKNQPEMASRFVFITGGTFTASTRTFLSRISNLCIEKPFDSHTLRKIVNNQLTLHARRSSDGGDRNSG